MKRAAFAALLSCFVSCATTESAEKNGDDGEERAEKPRKSGAVITSLGTFDIAAMQAQAMKIGMATQAARTVADATCAKYQRREVPWPEERRVGDFLAVRALEQHKAFTDDALPQRVALVGKLLARRSKRPDLPWTFAVLENEVPDAKGLPAGFVFITTGLLKHLKNEAELAAVLSHEIAHVAARDPIAAYSRSLANQCTAAVTVAELARNGVSPGPAQQQFLEFAQRFSKPEVDVLLDADRVFESFLFDTSMMLASWDKEPEYLADAGGAELMAFCGYDLTGFDSLLNTLEALPLANKDGKTFREGWLVNQPPTDARLAKIKALREGELAAFNHGAAKPDLTELLAPLKK